MNKSQFQGMAAVLIGLLIGYTAWWVTTEVKVSSEPLNQHDAYVYSNNAMIHWFELSSRKGKVEGYFHEGKLIEEDDEPPLVERQKYPLTGKKTKNGYELTVNKDGNKITYDVAFSGPHLSVQKPGEHEAILYNPVNQRELDEYVTALLDYNVEKNEKDQIRQQFAGIHNVYGYLHNPLDGNQLLFIKIDEALLEGELSASLLIVSDTGNAGTPYKETKYVLNGITDGNMLELYTYVDGQRFRLKGNFNDMATSVNLSLWTTGEKLDFHAVTEEEFKQTYEKFKQEN
ncbi:hypothetical protein AM500_04475 [Bacillus sp. FJAT-18017]|uniref:hypothetical protein n=1 Tax=Bacillus sp. FJAT-18017 TaxID=1705566 RepID=UPI0006AE368B|nr:hypothetical protein [Bacillus sp. FJAT-18017]ALC89128.1 hypothetical protein AM500_04475 [Bacillus sp. FJAT-18017]